MVAFSMNSPPAVRIGIFVFRLRSWSFDLWSFFRLSSMDTPGALPGYSQILTPVVPTARARERLNIVEASTSQTQQQSSEHTEWVQITLFPSTLTNHIHVIYTFYTMSHRWKYLSNSLDEFVVYWWYPSSKCSGRTVRCGAHCRPTVKQYSVPTVRTVHTLFIHCRRQCALCLHWSDFVILGYTL